MLDFSVKQTETEKAQIHFEGVHFRVDLGIIKQLQDQTQSLNLYIKLSFRKMDLNIVILKQKDPDDRSGLKIYHRCPVKFPKQK